MATVRIAAGADQITLACDAAMGEYLTRSLHFKAVCSSQTTARDTETPTYARSVRRRQTLAEVAAPQ
jgi:hypothetical protein